MRINKDPKPIIHPVPFIFFREERSLFKESKRKTTNVKKALPKQKNKEVQLLIFF